MASEWFQQYKGPTLPPRITTFLSRVQKAGFEVEVTGRAGKTIRVSQNGRARGYVNASVLSREGVIGYAFDAMGGRGDHAPNHVADGVVEAFCARHGCTDEHVVIHTEGTGKTYLVIADPDLALQVLERDASDVPAPAQGGFEWGTPMALNRLELGLMRDAFLASLPDFVDFRESGSVYRRRERDYKVELATRCRERLVPALFGDLGSPDSGTEVTAAVLQLFGERLASIGDKQNLVGWRYMKMLTDMHSAEKGIFAEALFDLIFAESDAPGRAADFVARTWPIWMRLSPQSKPYAQARLFPSVFLMMMEPKTSIAVRTDMFDATSRRLLGRSILEEEPMTATHYQRILDYSEAVYNELSAWGWRPHDMIDVHSFLWVAANKNYVPMQREDLEQPA